MSPSSIVAEILVIFYCRFFLIEVRVVATVNYEFFFHRVITLNHMPASEVKKNGSSQLSGISIV